MAGQSDMIPSYEFTVSFDALSFSFCKVSNIGGSIEYETIVDGGHNSSPVILRKPKRTPDTLLLERGLHSTFADVAFAVFKEGRKIDAININVKRNGKTVRMFFITSGVIVQREFSPLDAMESEVLMQTIKIAHTGLTEVPLPFGL